MKKLIHRLTLIFTLAITPSTAQTGAAVPELVAFDQAMQTLMAKYKIPGGALAVSKDNRLVLARGYGFADRNLKTSVQPDSLFRVGSISKPITVMTALRLVQDGKLSLDAPIVPLLGRDNLPSEIIKDSRWNQITVRHLMQHSGGWDAELAGFDPLTSYTVVIGLGLKLPLRPALTRDQVIRYMAAEPLQFAPGTQQQYSNFGMMMLGRLLEKVAGVPYEKLIRDVTLEPMGIQRMGLSGSLPTQRRLGEVEYYDVPGADPYPALFPGIGENVPAPDGGYSFELIEAAGAWMASPIDLLRFVNGVDGRIGQPLLGPSLIREMTARPSFDKSTNPYIGLGWLVAPSIGLEWGHNGAIEGSYAWLARSNVNGISFAVTFNTFPYEDDGFDDDLLGTLSKLAFSIRQWPAGDAFPTYLPPATQPRISGVVDSGSQQDKVAPGALVSIYGLNLGPVTGLGTTLDGQGRVTTRIGDTQVFFDGIAAPLTFVSRNQVNAVAPFLLSSKTQTNVQVVVGNGRSQTFTSVVRNSAPGVFTLSGNGRGTVVMLNGDGSINGESAGAARGSVVTLWATGLDAFQTRFADGEVPRQASELQKKITVQVDGKTAEVLYAGSAPGLVAGLVQLNVRVPAAAAQGRVPMSVILDGQSSRPSIWLWTK